VPPKDLTQKLSQQVAHVTWKRTSDPKLKLNGVSQARLLNLILAEVQEFAGHLRPEYKSIWDQRVLIDVQKDRLNIKIDATRLSATNEIRSI
jgi:hypothetical protein